jgi:phenylacetate-coenzyme A ligase PaaK-like adenylate-forming protein
LDDLVTVGPGACPCGQPFRTFKFIEAKKQDYFRLPGDREFYPWAICLLLIDEAPWILQFQLVQERVDRVVMQAEAAARPSDEELERLRGLIRPMLGERVEFAIEIVPEIELTPGGKFWVRRSLVNSMYEDDPQPCQEK